MTVAIVKNDNKPAGYENRAIATSCRKYCSDHHAIVFKMKLPPPHDGPATRCSAIISPWRPYIVEFLKRVSKQNGKSAKVHKCKNLTAVTSVLPLQWHRRGDTCRSGNFVRLVSGN